MKKKLRRRTRKNGLPRRKAGKNWKKFWKLGAEEFNTQFFDINKDGELSVREGNYIYNLNDIVKKYGSPVGIVFPFILEERLEDLQDYFRAHMKLAGYRGKFYYHYPMKVNQNKEFIMPLISEGAHMEVGSVNELWLVKKLWEGNKFHSKLRVLCNGPKTEEYVKLIEDLRHDNLAVMPIIEDEHELTRLSKYRGDVGIRVNLDTKADTHWDKKVDCFVFF